MTSGLASLRRGSTRHSVGMDNDLADLLSLGCYGDEQASLWWEQLGRCYAALGSGSRDESPECQEKHLPAVAVVCYQVAWELDAGNLSAANELAVEWVRQGRWERAESVLQDALRHWNDVEPTGTRALACNMHDISRVAWLNLADVSWHLGLWGQARWAEAKAELEDAGAETSNETPALRLPATGRLQRLPLPTHAGQSSEPQS